MRKLLFFVLVTINTFASDSTSIKKSFLYIDSILRSKPIEAEKKADSLLKICEKMNWNNGIAQSYYYLAAVKLYNLKNSDNVNNLLNKAELLNTNTELLILIYSAKSYSKIIEDSYEEAFTLSSHALDLANKINSKQHFYRIYINLGNVYAKLDNHEKALEYYEKAHNDKNNKSSDEQKIILFNNILVTLTKKINVDKANYYANESLKILESNTELRKIYGQISYLGIAYNFILSRQLEKAEYFLKLIEKMQIGNEPNYLTAYYHTNLGYIQMCKKEFTNSESNLKRSVFLSLKFKDNYIRYRTYQILANLYFSKGIYESGLTFQEKSFALRDSITSYDHQKFISQAETKYKTAEKEIKLKEAKLEIAKKQNWLIGLSLGFLGILISVGLLWRISKIKTKASELEKLKNQEIEGQKNLIQAKEVERQRIAKELHDSVGSQLTVVSTSLDNAFYLFENQKLKPEKLENISGEVRLAAQSLRDTIWATHNSEISLDNLKSRIQDFVKKFTDENSFSIELDIKGDGISLSPIEGLNIFRIVQEALNNIQKYAKASKVKIIGEFSKNSYELEIADNGIGFDASQLQFSNSFGLNNMKIRAEEIGGEFKIESNDKGSRVCFRKNI